jgi:rhodanese-related sulfurtransferase
VRAAALLVAVLALAMPRPVAGDHAWAPVLTIDAESAKSLMDRGEPVEPLDLRSTTEFQTGRLPRARSLPLRELPERVDEVPQRGIVVLYCGCPRDELFRAYQFLRGRRHANVYVLEGGIEAWQRLGYALER